MYWTFTHPTPSMKYRSGKEIVWHFSYCAKQFLFYSRTDMSKKPVNLFQVSILIFFFVMKGLIIKVQYFMAVKKYVDGNYFYGSHNVLLVSIILWSNSEKESMAPSLYFPDSILSLQTDIHCLEILTKDWKDPNIPYLLHDHGVYRISEVTWYYFLQSSAKPNSLNMCKNIC